MKIPCKDCLVLPLCKLRLEDFTKTGRSGVTGVAEREKCPELAAFLFFSYNLGIDIDRAREVFDLRKIGVKDNTPNVEYLRSLAYESKRGKEMTYR